MKRIEQNIFELCEEIDFWKSEAMRFKELYEEERYINTENIKNDLHNSYNMVGQTLSMLLRVEETDQGILIKQNR